MGHLAQSPSRILPVDLLHFIEQFYLLGAERFQIEVYGRWDAARAELLVVVIDVRHDRTVRPCFDGVSEQRLIVDGEMEALSVVHELLQLQVGHKVAGLFVGLGEENFATSIELGIRPPWSFPVDNVCIACDIKTVDDYPLAFKDVN